MFIEGIMGHRVIQNLAAVGGDKSLFWQWQQKFTADSGQVKREYDELVRKSGRDIDMGKEQDKVITAMRRVWWYNREESGDIRDVCIDVVEMDARVWAPQEAARGRGWKRRSRQAGPGDGLRVGGSAWIEQQCGGGLR